MRLLLLLFWVDAGWYVWTTGAACCVMASIFQPPVCRGLWWLRHFASMDHVVRMAFHMALVCSASGGRCYFLCEAMRGSNFTPGVIESWV
jgi:hypothetical protein